MDGRCLIRYVKNDLLRIEDKRRFVTKVMPIFKLKNLSSEDSLDRFLRFSEVKRLQREPVLCKGCKHTYLYRIAYPVAIAIRYHHMSRRYEALTCYNMEYCFPPKTSTVYQEEIISKICQM